MSGPTQFLVARALAPAASALLPTLAIKKSRRTFFTHTRQLRATARSGRICYSRVQSPLFFSLYLESPQSHRVLNSLGKHISSLML
jgi:hypothetical protein